MDPLIFTKKTFLKISESSPELLAFENVLALVCKLYYKSSFSIDDYMRFLTVNSGNKDLQGSTTKEPTKRPKKKKGGFRGIPAHKKDEPEEDIEKLEDDAEQDDYTREPPTSTLPIEARLNVLEKLISPIRQEYEFGKDIAYICQEKWTVKEIAIFESSICIFGKRFELIQKMVEKILMFKRF